MRFCIEFFFSLFFHFDFYNFVCSMIWNNCRISCCARIVSQKIYKTTIGCHSNFNSNSFTLKSFIYKFESKWNLKQKCLFLSKRMNCELILYFELMENWSTIVLVYDEMNAIHNKQQFRSHFNLWTAERKRKWNKAKIPVKLHVNDTKNIEFNFHKIYESNATSNCPRGECLWVCVWECVKN